MKATELRIGNLVSDGVFEIEVTAIEKDIIKGMTQDRLRIEYSFNIENLQGIPLTEEWLLKFGLKQEDITPPSKQHGKYFSIGCADYKYSFAYASFREDWGFYHSYCDAVDEKDNNRFDFISCGIKYVHQLQNLYFALTGEELTIL